MKITLNSIIADDQRASALEIVSKAAPGAEILWLPSRFPRLVMLVLPDEEPALPAKGDSIFDHGVEDALSPATLALRLEEQLQKLFHSRDPANALA